MKILRDIIPEKYRKYTLYAPFALVGLIIGCFALVSNAPWIGEAAKVYSFVGSALGLTAFSNTGGGSDSPPSGEPPADE